MLISPCTRMSRPTFRTAILYRNGLLGWTRFTDESKSNSSDGKSPSKVISLSSRCRILTVTGINLGRLKSKNAGDVRLLIELFRQRQTHVPGHKGIDIAP